MRIRITLIFISIFSLFALSSCQEKDGDSLEKKAAKMLIIGFRGTTIEDSNHIKKDIINLGIGGVILFEYDAPSKSRPRNIISAEQLKKLTTNLQNISSEKLIIAIDQEGGKVNRLKTKYNFPPAPSAKNIAEINNIDSSNFYAELLGKTVYDAGINLNFAPVVDVDINPDCPVIGKIERSFSENPEIVTKEATISITGMHKYGVKSCLKHFPGHGSALSDSHLGFTDVTNSWSKKELIPYSDLINSGICDAIMTAHIFNANIDPNYPATLSETTINNLLRKELYWNGLVISDDMDMGAIANNYGLEEAIKLSINAGVDILIFSNNGKKYNPNIASEAVKIIVNLVENGEIEESRIDEACRRIEAFKEKKY